MNITVIGKGDFGTSIASLLEHNAVDFTFTTKDTSLQQRIDVAFFAVPTQSLRQAFSDNLPFFDEHTIIVNCSKGIEEGTHLLPYQIINSFGVSPRYLTLIGPSFAKEIVNQDPTLVSLGYRDLEAAKIVSSLITTPYFAMHETPDYKTLELAGAMKNVYAILCGYAHGIGFGMNTNVRIILGVRCELEKLARALHYPTRDIDTPGIIGDLILTCTSSQSRNYTYGYNLARRHDISPHETRNTTVEGYHTCHSISTIAKEHRISVPLAMLTTKITNGNFIAPEEFRAVLSQTETSNSSL